MRRYDDAAVATYFAAALEFAASAVRHGCAICGWDPELADSALGSPPPVHRAVGRVERGDHAGELAPPIPDPHPPLPTPGPPTPPMPEPQPPPPSPEPSPLPPDPSPRPI